MTELSKIQKQIDRCNNKDGCNKYCSSVKQEECYLLEKHRNRIRWCTEHNIPIERW